MLPDFIKSRIGCHKTAVRKAGTTETLDAEGRGATAATQPSPMPADLIREFGFTPLAEPFTFTVGHEFVSVTMGSDGAVISEIPIRNVAEIEFLIQCTEAIQGFMATRQEPWAAVASVVFFGGGVGVEVRRRFVAIRVRLLAYVARTPAEVAQVIVSLNQLLLEVKSRPSRWGDQHSDSGRVTQNFQVAG